MDGLGRGDRADHRGGRVREPDCGAGGFIAAAPSGNEIVGVELYPDARIRTASFADTRLPNGWADLGIGNVPFGDYSLHDPRHNSNRHSIHNHYIVKGLHLTRPGGLLAVITSRYTTGALNPAARREMAGLADLVCAVRLPGNAHHGAGVDVVTDVLILQRHTPGQEPAGPA